MLNARFCSWHFVVVFGRRFPSEACSAVQSGAVMKVAMLSESSFLLVVVPSSIVTLCGCVQTSYDAWSRMLHADQEDTRTEDVVTS
eukprot:5374302-Amphidinium_carterae.1